MVQMMRKKPSYKELEKRVKELEGELQKHNHGEPSLNMSEALFWDLFNNIPSGCAIYEVINDGSKGTDYIIKNFNKASLTIEGKPIDRVIGKTLYDLLPNLDDYDLVPVLKKVWKPEYRISFQPGSFKLNSFQVTLNPIFSNFLRVKW